MKRIWTFLLFLASTAVFLFACSSQAAEPITPTAAATAVPDAPTASPASDSDLSRIGQTGRPQFLNAYASW